MVLLDNDGVSIAIIEKDRDNVHCITNSSYQDLPSCFNKLGILDQSS